MKRFTETEKWADAWFRSLTPLQKCVFLFCCDRCNNAGFIEIDFSLWSFHVGAGVEEISKAFADMCDKENRIIVRQGWAYLRNFLRHQKNLPLFPHKNHAHKQIVNMFMDQATRFPKLIDSVVLESLHGEQYAIDYKSDDWLKTVCRHKIEDKKEDPKKPDKEKESQPKKKERNPVIDALAECDGDPLQIPSSAWGRIAKSLAEIKAVCPDVTPDEIRRRASNYRTHFRDAHLTSSALAKHWARCDKKHSSAPVQAELLADADQEWIKDRS